MLRVANSTPMVDLDSRLNSFRVKRESKLDFPTPESPIRTTGIFNEIILLIKNLKTFEEIVILVIT